MTIKTHPLRLGQKGFMLIEIVMVLVLLGILAAVAVPKYFDLREQAEEKAAQAIVQEGQARLNGMFAEHILAGKQCKDFASTDTFSTFVADMLASANGKYYFTAVPEDSGKGLEWVQVSVVLGAKTYEESMKVKNHKGVIYFPTCNN